MNKKYLIQYRIYERLFQGFTPILDELWDSGIINSRVYHYFLEYWRVDTLLEGIVTNE